MTQSRADAGGHVVGDVAGRGQVGAQDGQPSAQAVQLGEPTGDLGVRAGPVPKSGGVRVVEQSGLKVGQHVHGDGLLIIALPDRHVVHPTKSSTAATVEFL